MLNNFIDKGLEAKIYWYFQENDDDMLEAGEDLSEMVDLCFQYVMVKPENLAANK
jgi:hypothetical protein